jgi:hypothetical protein
MANSRIDVSMVNFTCACPRTTLATETKKQNASNPLFVTLLPSLPHPNFKQNRTRQRVPDTNLRRHVPQREKAYKEQNRRSQLQIEFLLFCSKNVLVNACSLSLQAPIDRC